MIWIDYLRGRPGPVRQHVRDLIRDGAPSAITEPIAMEFLAGTPVERRLERLETLVSGLPLLAVDAHLEYRAAATTYRSARRRGLTVRELVDCLIAAGALRAGTRLVDRDIDFEVIAAVVPLDAVSPTVSALRRALWLLYEHGLAEVDLERKASARPRAARGEAGRCGHVGLAAAAAWSGRARWTWGSGGRSRTSG